MIYMHGYKNYNPKYFPMKEYRVRKHVVEEYYINAKSKKEAIRIYYNRNLPDKSYISKIKVVKVTDETGAP